MEPPPQRPDFDQALKRLLLRAHDGFLALIAPGLTWCSALSPELPAVARQADLVWEVEHSEGQRGLLHIELQTKADADIGERLAEYGIRLWRRERRPVRSLVVFLRPTATVPQSPFVINWMGRECLRYGFDVVRLWEIPPDQVLNTAFYELWPLTSLMAGASADTTLDIVERLSTAPVPAQERAELTRLLVLLAGLRVPHTALQEALRRKPMIEDLWKESSLAEALADRFQERGMGRMAQVVLESRLGPLSDDILMALKTADEVTLEAIGMHVATDTIEQVRARLGLS